MTSTDDPWLSVAQVAALTGYSVSTVHNLIKAKRLSSRQLTPRGKRQIRTSEAMRFLATLEPAA